MHTKGDLHEEKKDDLVHSVDCDNGLLLFSRIYDRSMGMITWKVTSIFCADQDIFVEVE